MVAAVVVAATTVASCADSGGPDSDGPLPGIPKVEALVVANHRSTESTTWRYGSLPICLSKPGPVVLESIKPDLLGPVKLARAGVHTVTNGEYLGGLPGKLGSDVEELKGFTVDTTCDGEPKQELELQLERAGSGSAALKSFVLKYTANGRPYQAHYAVTIVLCDGADPGGEEIMASCAEPQ